MKINWFSPLSPSKSDIAHYTARILPTLKEVAKITLWTDQTKWDPFLENYAEVRSYQLEQMPWAELNRADISIYQIGNHPHFHGAIWQVIQRHPGIVILHDSNLQGLFASLYRDQWQNRDGYLAQMELYYGEDGRRAAKCFLNGEYSIEYMGEKYPLTLLALENALGVLVHTRLAFDCLRRKERWPITYAPLPYPATPHSKKFYPKIKGGPPYRLIVFGYLSHHRRLNTLLQALAEFSENKLFHLDIYGDLPNHAQVCRQIKSLGLTELVTVHGFVPEPELDDALNSAHLAVNLRSPGMGEASGSELRIWDHALPSLVTRVGWYASLPEDAVAFVRPEHEIEDIPMHLRAFLDAPERFAKMGENARKVLEEQHSPELYVQALMNFVAQTQSFRSYFLAHKLTERVGAEISTWTRTEFAEENLRKLAEGIYSIV